MSRNGFGARRSLPSRWQWAFIASIAIVLISGGLAVREYVRFSEAASAIEHTYRVLGTVDDTLAALLDAETGARGYLLTGVPRLMEPYHRKAPTVASLTTRLEQLVADDPTQHARARELAALSRQKLDGLRSSVQEFDNGQGPRAVARVSSGRGQQHMDAIRGIAATMKQTERGLLAHRETQARLARRASLLFAGASLIVAIALGGAAVSVDRLVARRRADFEHEMAARLAAERSMRSAAQELSRSERLNRSILDSSADCIQVLAPDGRLLLMNEPGCRLLHIDDLEPFRGLPWPELWGDSAAGAREAVETAVRQVTARFRAFCPTLRGEPRWWDVIVTPILDADGAVARLLCISRDITEHTRAEQERNQLLASERAARAEAERAVHMKDEFLATLSHELRTPLNAIVGWVGVLQQDGTPATVGRALSVIDRNARRQAQLIDDLLDVSRIVSGRLRLNLQPVDLSAVVDEAVAAVQPAADAKGVRVIVEPAGPVLIDGDPGRLLQVVWNLASNAIKFTDRGGEVRVGTRETAQQAEVRVSDTGRGIDPDLLPHVFQRFRQGDSSATRAHGGLGLGLAIVKNVVEMHGGAVEASSDGPNRGATFLARLPRRHGPGAGHPLLGARTLLAGVRALVVEDDADGREFVQRLLTETGAVVRACASAAEALQCVREEPPPDVVVSDVGLPELDGYDFLRQLRKLDRPVASVPAVALTALGQVEDRRRALAAGYQAHLVKPVDPGELISSVAMLVGRTAVSG